MKLIDKYLPSDYTDSVSKRIKSAEPLSPDCIFEEMFCNFPKPVNRLFKLRNAIVKPLGLHRGGLCYDCSKIQQSSRQDIFYGNMGVSQTVG